MLPIFYTLGVLHTRDQPVLHRDISLCNFLIREQDENGTLSVVLNDFDVAREITNEVAVSHKTTKVGKLAYNAPEVDTGLYDASADIWACGIAMYELMTLKAASVDNTWASRVLKS